MRLTFLLVLSFLLVGACGGSTAVDDAGRVAADAPSTLDAASADDGGPTADDAATTAATDAFSVEDAFASADDAGGGGSDAGGSCGGECAGFPTLERGCTLAADGSDVNCAPELHQVDCCGTMHVLGINHGVVDTFCPAEATCRASYPAAACDPGPYVLDSGETTTDLTTVHVRCNIPSGASVGRCETYLGAADGRVGSCG